MKPVRNKSALVRRVALAYAAVILLFAVCISASGAVRVASWNLKHLGWDNDKNFDAVAEVIARFDLVALQEVMNPAAATALADRVSKR